jgi:hypothetical protein
LNILDFYPEAVAAAAVPDWHELLRRHPELQEELPAWLAAKDRWQFALRRFMVRRGNARAIFRQSDCRRNDPAANSLMVVIDT